MKKRGQITLFIVLGIVILLVIGLFFFIRARIAEKKLLERPVIELPTELKPVQFFAEQCLEKIAVDGFKLIGAHGGYINPDAVGKFDYDAQTESDGLMLSPNGLKVVYWLYNKALPNEKPEFASLRPVPTKKEGKNSIEEQVEQYIEDHIDDCFGDFKQFTEKGFRIQLKGKPDARIVILPQKVIVHLDYDIEITLGEISSKLDHLYKELDLDIKGMYDMARFITELETNYTFIEERILSGIETFSDTTVENLPPMDESEFELAPTAVWLENDVKKKVGRLITSYIPLLRLEAPNKFEADFDDLTAKAFYNNFLIPVESKYAVRFDYLGWPFYFDVNDDAGLIMPEHTVISSAGMVFGIQRYKTLYDISVPILITITDKNALGKKGYSFSFAIEANIRNNEPMRPDKPVMPSLAFFEESLLCRENQRNSGEISIVVSDAYSNELLSDVSVFYSVGDESCFIGKTDSTGLLKTRLPVAFGGVLSFVKKGYLTGYKSYDALPGQSEKIKVGLYRIAELNASVEKRLIRKITKSFPFISGKTLGGWQYTGESIPLDDIEEAVITFRRIGDEEASFTSVLKLSGKNRSSLKLVPGAYEVSGTLIRNENLTIPKEKRCIKKKVLGVTVGKECFDIPAINLEKSIAGGVLFNNNTGYLILDPALVYNSKEIRFYLLSPALYMVEEKERKIEDLEQLGKFEEYTKQFYDDLLPVPVAR